MLEMLVNVENAEEVRILNSENQTYYYFTLRRDRLAAFYAYLMANRRITLPASGMPGISGPAMFGLDCIFFGSKPSRFPAKDILDWLRDQQLVILGSFPNPTITSGEIEAVLGQWAGTVTQLLADGTERA
jgi:hypothetical protein